MFEKWSLSLSKGSGTNAVVECPDECREVSRPRLEAAFVRRPLDTFLTMFEKLEDRSGGRVNSDECRDYYRDPA